MAERLFCSARQDLAAVHRAESDHTLRSFPLATRVRFRGEFRQRDFVSDNVAGWLPGRDPALSETFVLVSAHYDHLGKGQPVDGDAVYNGLVDNALGVAGALELARALAARPRPPRRSVMFLFTTAEEEGLLGAIHYADHPLVPLYRTVANVNIDGLAHLDTFGDVAGLGSELSTLAELLAEVARRDGLEVTEPPAALALSDAYGLSDQAAFAEAGIPAILVKEGFRWTHHSPDEALALLLAWGRSHYHQPSDDAAQPVDFEASRQHLALLLDLVERIAEDEEAPQLAPRQPLRGGAAAVARRAALRVRTHRGARAAPRVLSSGLAALLAWSCAGSVRREAHVVRLVGSDTMRPLAERWAAAFMEARAGAVVHVVGGGTGAGVAALVDGTTDLAMGSRPLLPDEVRQLATRHASLGVSYRCARDALSVYLNPGNPVREMSLLQLKGLFAGRIGGCHKVGGREESVRVLVRPPNSGTYRLFQELVLTEEAYSDRAETLPTTAAIVDAVRRDPTAVGYGGVAYGKGLVHCAIDGQVPSAASVRDGSYPLARYLYLHAVRPPRGATRDFVDFVSRPSGQRIVEEVGYVPLWEPAAREASPTVRDRP